MAYLFIDACDSYTTQAAIGTKYDAVNALVAIGSGRFGGNALYTQSNGAWVQMTKLIPARGSVPGTDDLFVGWSHYAHSNNAVRLLMVQNTFNSSTSTTSETNSPTTLTLATTAAGICQLRLAGVVVATGTTVLAVGTYYRFEVKVSIHNSTGIFEFRINGAPEITFAGDTYTAGETLVRSLTWFGGFNDDIVIWDSITKGDEPTSWIGDIRIDTLRPVADGDAADSTPNTGARWAAVAEANSDGESTFVYAGAAGDKDLYILGDLTDVPDSVLAVNVYARWRSGGTTGREGRMLVKSGATEGEGESLMVATGSIYGSAMSAFPVNPDTGLAWTPSEINGMQIGWKVQT